MAGLKDAYENAVKPEDNRAVSQFDRYSKENTKMTAAQSLRKKTGKMEITAPISDILKRKENKPVIQENNDLSYDEQLEREFLEHEKLEGKMKIRKNRQNKVVSYLMIAACLYLVFLIYGAFMTKYQYSEDGTVKPVTMNIIQIKKAKQFEDILDYYEQCRRLYESVLDIDYRLAKNANDGPVLAAEYNNNLKSLDSMITNLSALNEQPEYSVVKTLLLNWCKNDMAVYLQNISNAITSNDTQKASNALEDRERTKSDFMLIRDNFISLGNSLHGVDMTEQANWSVDSYVGGKYS